ncbi:nucleoside hydrolase [Sphingomonas sp. MMS24-J13]|uniref:nucleoside hydrolase n=1 Tax=Sphingomonas sp. MMS24-J13 TaxID=3238686 RepID=UPI00384ACC51
MTEHRLILDTDPGIDDAMTFAFLRGREDVTIRAITTVYGNVDVGIATRNALFLADRFGIDAPVHAGAAGPLATPRRPAPAHVHGLDGFGDTRVADRFAAEAAEGNAAEAIVRLVRAEPGAISILAIGPLTNLALALALDPGIAGLVREVVIMGGSLGYGERRGNVTPVAEANVANDPVAADRVLGAAWPVTMVGLDVTARCILPAVLSARLAGEGAIGRFLYDISRDYEQLYRTHDGIDGCCIHDVAAAVRLVAPDLFETVSGPIRAVTSGIAAGQTILKPIDQSFPPGAWDGLPVQRAAIHVDVDRLLALYEAAIAR